MDHPVWGNPRANQTSAEFSDCNGVVEVVHPPFKFLGLVLREERKTVHIGRYREISTERGDEIPDHVDAKRQFSYRCGLIKAVGALSQTEDSWITLYLDGYPVIHTQIWRIEFRIDPKIDSDVPVADVVYEGRGTRYGVLRAYQIISVDLTFKSREQIGEYVGVAVALSQDAGESKAPQVASPSGNSSQGSSLLPLVAGIALGIALD